MRIDRRGDLPAIQVPEAAFKGDVAVTGYVRRAAPSRLAGATVTFAPGSRTPWKVNPCGQTLVVTDGVGWAQCEGGKIAEIRAGDVVWFAPGVRHWEGATPDASLTYVAFQEAPDGVGVEFGEAVGEDVYGLGVTKGCGSSRGPASEGA